MNLIVEVSARHIHLSEKDFLKLFGSRATLNIKRKLSQKGQFLSDLKLEVKTAKASIKNVSVLGPFRDNTQIEVSLTDSYKLGISVPIRESGVLENTPGCFLQGPACSLEINKGLIVAKRHIHLSKETSRNENFKNNDKVCVKIKSCERSLIFCDTVIRVHESFSDVLHIDTDEANAAGIKGSAFCTIL